VPDFLYSTATRLQVVTEILPQSKAESRSSGISWPRKNRCVLCSRLLASMNNTTSRIACCTLLQKHELKMKGWSDKLKELDALGKTHCDQKSQQVCLCMHLFDIASCSSVVQRSPASIIQHVCLLQAQTSFVFPQAYSVPHEQSRASGTSVYDQPEDSGDEYDASSSSSSSQGPPGFSSTVKGSQVRASPRIAFCRLQENPGMP